MNDGEADTELTARSCRNCGSIAFDERGTSCCSEQMAPISIEAINEPELTGILSRVFGISPTGVEICHHLTGARAAATDEIARALDINRSTANRQLGRLRELGMLERRTKSLKVGGRAYLYAPVSRTELRRRYREGLLCWTADAIELVDELCPSGSVSDGVLSEWPANGGATWGTAGDG